MTRGQMEAQIALDLSEVDRGGAAANPFSLRNDVIRAADEIAETTDSLFGTYTITMTATQATYCLPPIYKWNDAAVADSNGNWHPFGIYDRPGDASVSLGANWRNDIAQDPPTDIIFNGVTSLTLHPAPSVTRANALMFLGFWKAGDSWVYVNGVGITPAASDECPLPVWAHPAVVALAKFKRAIRDTRPEIIRQLPFLKDDSDKLWGNVEANAALHHQNIAHNMNFPQWCSSAPTLF